VRINQNCGRRGREVQALFAPVKNLGQTEGLPENN
jgi:hypothetical protein